MVPLLLGLLILYLFAPVQTLQADSSVVINEILPHPSAEEDWVEIYNSTEESFSLSGWKLKDTATSPLKEFGPTDAIAPQSYLVISAGDRLNNSGDTVTLLDNNGTVIDSYQYSSSSLETSFGRNPDGGSNWVTFPAPSKGIANGPINSPSPSQSSITSGISLSEFMPNPETGNQEWVELFNDNLTTLSITGFKIDDIEGGSSPYTIPEETIPAKGFFYIMLPNAILNNDTDTIRLLAPNGDLLESYSYRKTTKNYSWIKNSGSWSETSTPTLGTQNILTAVAIGSATPTKSETKKLESTPAKKPSAPTGEVLASKTITSTTQTESTSSASNSAAVSTIKLNLKGEKKPAEVLGNSYSKYLSYALMLLGAIVIATPLIIIFKKRHA